MAGALYAGDGAAVAFESAGHLWGFVEDEPESIDLWTPRTLRGDGVIFHRARTLLREDVTRLGPIPITSPARTLIDLAAHLEEASLEEVVHAALSRNPSARGRLERRLQATGTRGRGGARTLLELIAMCPHRTPESRWETRVFRDLRSLGPPLPVPQYPFRYETRRFRHDFFYTDGPLGIECDSRENHLSPRDFERERYKLNALQQMPWRVIHVTYRRYMDDREGFLDDVARALGRSGRCRNL